VTVIDGVNNTTTTVAAAPIPAAVAVNPVTDKIYVANFGSANVTVIDGITESTTTVAAGANPSAVAVNPVSNKIYVANQSSANVTVIDGITESTTTVAAGANPSAVAVNPVSNKIYVANQSSNNVTVIDGVNNTTTTTVAVGSNPVAVAVNPATDKIYVANFHATNVTVIDGATNTTATVAVGSNPLAVAVNPVTNKIYAANRDSANVTVVTDQSVHDVPLQVTIAPLAGNITASATPTFALTAASGFFPSAPPVEGVAYQVDTWQGGWRAASATGGNTFAATTPPLQIGVHVLYAYATDAQEATSINTGRHSSPLIGSIAAYVFTVVPAGTPPVFTAQSPPASATAASAYSYSFAATGNPPAAFVLATGSLPPGLHLDAFTGILGGTPTTVGAFTFGVRAANGVPPDAISPSITITVAPGPLDHLQVSPSTATIAAGTAQAYTAAGFDVFGNSLGDVTAATIFNIFPKGPGTGASCNNPAKTCTATQAGPYTITGSDTGKTGTATLTVAAGSGEAVSSWTPGRLDLFTRGTDNAIWHAFYTGAWSGWESLGPTIVSDPAAVSWGANRIDLFGVGTDGRVYHKFWGPGWSGWLSELGAPPPGVPAGSGPAVSSWGPGRLDVFVRGADNAIWHAFYAGTWSGWESLGTAIVSSPAAISQAVNHIDLFGAGTDGLIYHKIWNGSTWTGWVSGTGAPPPGVAGGSGQALSSWAPGRLDLYARGADNAIWHAFYAGAWSGWESLGTAIVSNPAAVSQAANHIDLFGTGTDGLIYHKIWNGSMWTGWVSSTGAPPPGVAGTEQPLQRAEVPISLQRPGPTEVSRRSAANTLVVTPSGADEARSDGTRPAAAPTSQHRPDPPTKP
jgi:YVTN family beta-propeller protein